MVFHLPKMKYARLSLKSKRTWLIEKFKTKTRKRKNNIVQTHLQLETFKAMKTKFGKELLIDKKKTKNNPLSKIFNRKPGPKILLPILRKRHGRTTCNCKNKNNCLISGKCCSQCIVYKASINNVNYTVMTEGEFKTRYNNHTHSFREPSKRNRKALSQSIWEKRPNP